MAVFAVIFPRDAREGVQLRRGERAARDRDPQHVGMELKTSTIHQAKRLESVLGELAREPPRHLIAELAQAFGYQGAVEIVVDVQGPVSLSFLTDDCLVAGSANVGPAARMRSRRFPGSMQPSQIATGAA
jgi:hypothetical protein